MDGEPPVIMVAAHVHRRRRRASDASSPGGDKPDVVDEPPAKRQCVRWDEDRLSCLICAHLLYGARAFECGHRYCQVCCDAMEASNASCPECRAHSAPTLPVHDIRSAVREHVGDQAYDERMAQIVNSVARDPRELANRVAIALGGVRGVWALEAPTEKKLAKHPLAPIAKQCDVLMRLLMAAECSRIDGTMDAGRLQAMFSKNTSVALAQFRLDVVAGKWLNSARLVYQAGVGGVGWTHVVIVSAGYFTKEDEAFDAWKDAFVLQCTAEWAARIVALGYPAPAPEQSESESDSE